jgi:hypothetical protein
MHSHFREQHEASILIDIQKIENDINTKLGRGEISIETTPINLEDSVMVSLKTYLSPTSSMYVKEISTRNPPKKPKQRPIDEVTRAFDNWLQVKKQGEVFIARKESQSAKLYKQYAQEHRLIKQKNSEEAYNRWLNMKNTENALIKKKLSVNGNDIKQEINGT